MGRQAEVGLHFLAAAAAEEDHLLHLVEEEEEEEGGHRPLVVQEQVADQLPWVTLGQTPQVSFS